MSDPSKEVPRELPPLDPATRRERDALIDDHLRRAQGVLHLGAHTGQERDDYARRGLAVIWVEAHPVIHQRLRANIDGYDDQRALCGVLADVDGREVRFGRSATMNGQSSSMFAFGADAHALWPDQELEMIERLTLPTVTLDSLLAQNGIDPADYDFWVLDVQGAELLALQGAMQSLRSCRALLTEASMVEVYQGGSRWPELRDHLQARGFSPLWSPVRQHDDVLFLPRTSFASG